MPSQPTVLVVAPERVMPSETTRSTLLDGSVVGVEVGPISVIWVEEDTMVDTPGRTRGLSPRGIFEISKEAARVLIDADSADMRIKTDRLRLQRLAHAQTRADICLVPDTNEV